MKKRLLTLLLCLIGGNALLFAQQHDENRKKSFEKFKAEREAFITKEMGLTEEEAAAFWPLSNELQQKKFELNKEIRGKAHIMRRERRDGKETTENDYKKLVEAMAKLKIEEAKLEQEYLGKFLNVISAEKVFRYQNAEQEFARRTMNNREKGRRPD